jgi:hypothetical protein
VVVEVEQQQLEEMHHLLLLDLVEQEHQIVLQVLQ